MIAEYASIAGAPSPDTPWPLVMDIAQRGQQFVARTQLATLDGVDVAVRAMFDRDQSFHEERERLTRLAYPGSEKVQRFLPNGFAQQAEGGADG